MCPRDGRFLTVANTPAAIEKFDSALKLDPQSSEAKAGKRRAKERLQLEQALPLPTESK